MWMCAHVQEPVEASDPHSWSHCWSFPVRPGCWELNWGPLQEQCMCLTAQPSLQPCISFVYVCASLCAPWCTCGDQRMWRQVDHTQVKAIGGHAVNSRSACAVEGLCRKTNQSHKNTRSGLARWLRRSNACHQAGQHGLSPQELYGGWRERPPVSCPLSHKC